MYAAIEGSEVYHIVRNDKTLCNLDVNWDELCDAPPPGRRLCTGCKRQRDKEAQANAWFSAAVAKLKADGIDASDLDAVEKTLTRCVGGERLFRFWKNALD